MILKNISILNFKNIREASLSFSPKLNCFLGRNGEGKTNLLDAVYYLSFCRSSSNPIDSQVITHDQGFFVLDGNYENEEGEPVNVYCGMKRGTKKHFKRDKRNISVCHSTSVWCRSSLCRLTIRTLSPAEARRGASLWTW